MLGQTNAKIAGGANVEIIESKSNFALNNKNRFNEKGIYTDYGLAMYLPGYLFIEKDKGIFCEAAYPSGGQTLVLRKINLNEQTSNYSLLQSTETSVNLDFGQTYSNIPSIMSNVANFSPDKSKVVVLRQTSPFNTIYIVPLTKSNDVYSFGTVVTISDIPELSSITLARFVRFLDNNTFIFKCTENSKDSICVCRINNDDTISVVKKISLEDLNIGTTVITMLEFINGLALIIDRNTNIVSFIDIDNDVAVYTETLTNSIMATQDTGRRQILVSDNKVFISLQYSQNQPFAVYSVSNKVVTKHEFTVSSGTSIPSLQYFDFYTIFYADSNKIGIVYCRPTSPRIIGLVFYSFQDFILSSVEVVNDEINVSSSASMSCYIYEQNSLFFVMSAYQGSSSISTFCYIEDSAAYKLKYDNYIYLLSENSVIQE